jgi:hypothetical protein
LKIRLWIVSAQSYVKLKKATVLAMEQVQERSKGFFHPGWIELVELLSFYSIRLPTGGNAQNVPWRTAGVELNGFQQTRLSGIVLPDKEVQTAQPGKFEIAEKFETGDVEGWNHG